VDMYVWYYPGITQVLILITPEPFRPNPSQSHVNTVFCDV
jgi:hypothetical protein